MQDRLDQVIQTLQTDPGEAAVGAAVDEAMEVLYGGLRPLPSPDVPEAGNASDAVGQAEMALAQALEDFVQNGQSEGAKGRALDMKLFIEQMNEVAEAVGQITQQCGDGASLLNPPCDQLRPLLDEEEGTVRAPSRVKEGLVVKLRSPFVPSWFDATSWQETVLVTEPLSNRQCAVVFKETTGLMVRLKFQGITVVTDPWVATFGLPRGTQVPIWTIEWVPSQYVKEWNICNHGGSIVKDVTQRVVQDVPLNFFWKYYPPSPRH